MVLGNRNIAMDQLKQRRQIMKKSICWVLLILLLLSLTGSSSSSSSYRSSSSRSSGSSGSSAYQEAYKWVSNNTYTGSDGKLYWK